MEQRELKGTLESGDGYRIVATTRDIDRDGEVVEPTGVVNFNEYLANNPVLLWAHDYSKPPVGKAIGGEVGDDAIQLDIEFADTEFGREVKYLFDEGFMSSFSIGFIPKDYKTIDSVWHWTSWELLEVSAVPVPANSMANILRTAEQSGEELPQIKSLYRYATGGAEHAESRVAAKRREDTWQFYLDWLRKPTTM
jgi:HK97 family phage prohead protease